MSTTTPEHIDVAVVGAGFSGLYLLHRLREMGLTVRVFEAADGIGGTWEHNRYPGARCDIESVQYSYSFSPELEQEWTWSERYASQPEILRYLNHVADRFELRRDIRLGTRVTAATFDEAADRWLVELDNGDPVSATYCILAVGCLSTPQQPDLPGLDAFTGAVYHTGNWPRERVDFTGRRVGVIGTGSSAIQAIPIIAEQAAELVVFQRTANFAIPARNAPLAADAVAEVKSGYGPMRQRARDSFFGVDIPINTQAAMQATPAERERQYEELWKFGGLAFGGAYADLVVDREANETAAEFVRAKIRELVHDPAVAKLLTPTGYALGTKRLCLDAGYYETFNRHDVTLVDLRSTPLEAATPTGLRTSTTAYDLDCIVFATGFDAMTGTLLAIDVRGRDGTTLQERWADGPQTYLGVATAGFPNLFMVTGPGSPSVISNMITSIEQHVEWITECIAHVRDVGARRIEPTADAEAAWVAHVTEVAGYTLYPTADSWYTGANIAGKPRGFMPYLGGVGAYRVRCAEVAARDYEGFAFTR